MINFPTNRYVVNDITTKMSNIIKYRKVKSITQPTVTMGQLFMETLMEQISVTQANYGESFHRKQMMTAHA